MSQFKDKVVIITGGASGLGRAAVLKFCNEGANVVIWDLNEAEGREVVQLSGEKASFTRVNTAIFEEVVAAAQQVFDQYGHIDVLVNNAGITRDASLKKMNIAQWQAVIDVNLTGVFNCTKAVSPYMVEAGYGRIISTASVVALYGNYGQTNYAAAKAGVVGMTKVWSKELGRKGITANAVAPGFIETAMTAAVPEDVVEKVVQQIPVGRMGQPDDIANAYLFLASDQAAYINGTTLSVDGGLVL